MKADLTEFFFCVFLAETTWEERRKNFSKVFFWNFFKNDFFLIFQRNLFSNFLFFFLNLSTNIRFFCVIGYKKSSVFSGLLISILYYRFGISLIALEKLMAVILKVSSKKLREKNTLIFTEKSGKIRVPKS